jgi:hypothetical protein
MEGRGKRGEGRGIKIIKLRFREDEQVYLFVRSIEWDRRPRGNFFRGHSKKIGKIFINTLQFRRRREEK